MFIEKRKAGKVIKYYLVHSYRDNKKVEKIRRYLGKDLNKEELLREKNKAEREIKSLIEELKIKIFNFSLTKSQIQRINRYERKIKVYHLEHINWKRFTENFAYNTNAIEGSTVQLNEVPEILKKEKVQNSDEIETKGVANAVEFIRKTKEDLSLELIKKLHKICFEGSKHFAGSFRTSEVVIKDAKGNIVHAGVPVHTLLIELNEMIKWYKNNKNKFKPLILAAIIHNQFEHIHPFQDGNGRVGRLLLNFILIKNKYPPINIRLEDRKRYYEILQEYSKNHNLEPTIKFLISQYNKTLKEVSTKR